MICSKCKETVAGNDRYCPVCGNDLNQQADLDATTLAPELDATVLAAEPDPTVVSAEQVDVPVKPENKEQPPVIENSVSDNKATTLKIGIAVASAVAVIAVVFIVLLGAGKISFNNFEEPKPTVTQENPIIAEPEITEPEIGTISALPVVVGDKSNEKIMLNIKSRNVDNSEFNTFYFAMDYTDDLLPVYVGVQKDDEQYGRIIMHSAYIGNSMYYINNLIMPDKTIKEDNVDGIDEALMYFGIYEKGYLAEKNLKFEYLGKEKLETGNTYIYNVITDELTKKIWIDTETGCWVKVEGVYETSEIIIGDDVKLPEFDFKNAKSSEEFLNLEPDIGTELTIPFITGDVSAKKVMLKTKKFTGMGNCEVNWIAADYTNKEAPKLYFEGKVYFNEGTESTVVDYAYYNDKTYMITDAYPGETYFLEDSTVENQVAFEAIFGIYDEDYMNKVGAKFCYLGKETLLATGEAYVFKDATGDTESLIWIDADTGFWVKATENGQIVLEVTEIITGDDVDLPEMDFANAEAL